MKLEVNGAVRDERNNQPSDDDIDAAISGNIWRCGTYQRVREAIHLAARLERGGK